LAQVGDCLWPSPGDCEGFVPTSGECQRQHYWIARVIELPHLWVGSCGVLVRTRFVLHLLATEPPSIGRHNGDVSCRQAREPRERNRCLNCV